MQSRWTSRCRTVIAGLLAAFLTGGMAAAQTAPSDTKAWVSGMRTESVGSGATCQLVYKFTPGLFARYEVVQKMSHLSKYPEAQETMTNESTTTKHFRVVTADGTGAAQLEPIIDRVQMVAVFNGADRIEFDSQQPGDPPAGFENVASTVGKAMARVTMTSNGELTKVTPTQDAPPAFSALAAQADSKLNFLIPMPKEPVGVGAVWKDRYQVPVSVGNNLTQQVTLQREFELTKVAGSVATITFKTVVITPIGNPQIEAQLLQRKPNGTIEFDLDRGLIITQTTKASGQVVQAFGANTEVRATLETTERLIPTTAGVQPATLKQ